MSQLPPYSSPTIDSVNADANALVGQSLQTYGQLPNPQIAVDALRTSATPAIIAAMQSAQAADLGQFLTSDPAGTTGSQTDATQYLTQQAPPSHDPITMNQDDWSNYWSRVKSASGNDSQWKSFGQIPIANLDYMRTVSQGNAADVKKWQSYLNQNGWSVPNANGDGKAHQLEVSGVWDKDTQTSFTNYMVSRFLPDALWSQDETQKNRASIFLNALGFDVATMAKQMSDPATRAQVVTQWLNTHGPDVNMRDSINQFIDLYGKNNMPSEIAHMGSSFWSNLGDTLGHIPLIGNIASIPADLLAGTGLHWDMAWKNTSALLADPTNANLTDAEKQALAPAIQDAQNSQGWLGFLDAWDRLRTRTVLTLGYFVGDLASGKGVDNVFDPTSRARVGASNHETNLMAGFFGDQWAQDHPLLAGLGNVLGSIADDPLTYFTGGIGDVTKVGEIGGEMGTVAGDFVRVAGKDAAIPIGFGKGIGVLKGGFAAKSTLLSPTMVRDAFRDGRGPKYMLDAMLQPRVAARQEMARAIGRLPKNETGVLQASELLGLTTDSGEGLSAARQIVNAADDHERYALLEQNFAHKLHSPEMPFLLAEARKAYMPEYFNRLAKGKQLRIFTQSARHIPDRSTHVLLDDPLELARQVRDHGMVLGANAQQLDSVIAKALSTDPSTRSDAITELRALEEDLLKNRYGERYADFQQHVSRLRSGRGLPDVSESALAYLPVRDAAGRVVEGSKIRAKYTFDTGDPAKDEMFREMADDIRGHIDTIQQQHAADFERMVNDRMHGQPNTPVVRRAAEDAVRLDPTFQALGQQRGEQLRDFWQAMDKLPHKGNEGLMPAAATSGQFQVWGKTRYTPYDVLSYESPILRRAEWIQAKSRLDMVDSTWKKIVLMKWSSAARITLGDETVRAAIGHLLDGGPLAFSRYLARNLKDRMHRGEAVQMPANLRMTTHQMVQGFHMSDHIPYAPGTQGYTDALAHALTSIHGKTPEAKLWTEGMKTSPKKAEDNLFEWLKGDSAEAKEFVRRAGAVRDQDKREIARALNHQFQTLTLYDPTTKDGSFLFNWLHNVSHGKKAPDRTAVNQFTRKYALDETRLPLVAGRRVYGASTGVISQGFNRASDWFHAHFTDAWVTHARQRAFASYYEEYRKEIKRVYAGRHLSEQRIHEMAYDQAAGWVRKNTYQGTRSVLGASVRNIFPFWGATTNFNKFVLRTWKLHPWAVLPSLKVVNWSQQQINNGGFAVTIPWVNRILSNFGWQAGDDLTLDPGRLFFFTSDGYGGFMPGLGPFFQVPIRQMALGDPELASTLQQIPGFEFDTYNTPLEGPLETLASGLSMEMTGKPFAEGIPFIGRPTGYYEKQQLEREKQLHAEYLQRGSTGADASEAGAQSDVAGQTLAKGLLNVLVPLGAREQDPRAQAIQPALQAWDAARSNTEKSAVIKQFPDAAPLLRYYDSRTNEAQKQQIVKQNPWVAAYATGITASASENVSGGTESTLAQYQNDLQSGRLRYLTNSELIDKMLKNDQYNEAWQEWDKANAAYQSFLIGNGLKSTSKEASQYRKLYYDPVIQQIEQTHPEWAQQFTKYSDTSTVGLQVATMPLSTVETWEVIPKAVDLENNTSQSWRSALWYRQNATDAMRELIQNNRPKAERQQVLDQLDAYLTQLAQQDPYFAAQLGQFKWKDVNDLVTFEAENQNG